MVRRLLDTGGDGRRDFAGGEHRKPLSRAPSRGEPAPPEEPPVARPTNENQATTEESIEEAAERSDPVDPASVTEPATPGERRPVTTSPLRPVGRLETRGLGSQLSRFAFSPEE